MTQTAEQQKFFDEARMGAVGASECGLIMGAESSYKDITDVYLRLSGIEGLDQTDEESDDINRGRVFEPTAVRVAGEKLGVGYDYTDDKVMAMKDFRRKSPACPYLAATPDVKFHDSWGGEVKVMRPHKFKDVLENGIPAMHLWQMYAQLSAYPEWAGIRYILLDVISGRVEIIEVPRNAARIAELEAAVDKWWDRFIIGCEVPTPALMACDQPTTLPTKQPDYTSMTGETWVDIAERYVDAKRCVKAAEADLELAQKDLENGMKASKLQKARVRGHKFIYAQYAGSSRFNRKLLLAKYPEIDQDEFMEEGAPYWRFNSYLKKEKKGAAK